MPPHLTPTTAWVGSISGTKILDKKKEKTPLLARLALVQPYPFFIDFKEKNGSQTL